MIKTTDTVALNDVANNAVYAAARAQHDPRIKDLLANFGITLPTPDAGGRLDATAVDAVFAAKAIQYPMQFIPAKQAEIRDLLATTGRL
jgi:hypothetical protein